MADTLNFGFQIDAAAGGLQYDLQLNVVRPCIRLHHSPIPPAEATVIAFTSVPPLTASKNLRINADLTNPFASLPEQGVDQIVDSSTFVVNSRKLLITDVFVNDANGKAVPLFYRHDLPLTAKANSAVNLYDQDFNLLTDLPVLHWRTAQENSFYNNLTSTYNAETGAYQAYYISYLDSTGIRQVELLNNQLSFQELLVENYAEFTPEKRYYSIEERSNHLVLTCLFDYKTYSPTPQGLACRIPRQAYGEVQPPGRLDNTLPWTPKVINLDIYYTGQDYLSRRYFIPEFNLQKFAPYLPYKYNAQAPGIVLAKTVIKVPDNNLHVDPDNGFHLEVIVSRSDGVIRYALTTDPAKDLYSDPQGNLTGIRYRTDGFASYDLSGGLIQLKFPMELTDQIILNYYYQDKDYDYSLINLNPRFTSAIIDQEAVLYLAPPASDFSPAVNIYCTDTEENAAGLQAMLATAFPDAPSRIFTELSPDFWESAMILVVDAPEASLDVKIIQRALNAGRLIYTNPSQYATLKTALGVADTGILTVREISISYIHYQSGYLIQGSPLISPAVDRLGASWIALNGQSWFVEQGWFVEPWFQSLDLMNWGFDLADMYTQIFSSARTAYQSPLAEKTLYHVLLGQDNIIKESNHPTFSLVGLNFEQFLESYTTAGINSNQALVLGHIKVIGGGTQIQQIETVDCRLRGGGFKTPDHPSTFLSAYPETNWCFDQGRWDGQPYPGSAAVLIELPYTLLSDYGGSLSHQEILTKIKKHLALGAYPVVRYYGSLDPRLTSFTVKADSIDLTWEDVGGPYTVYWGLGPDSLINKAIVSTNSYTITNLKSGFHYSVLVTPIRDNSRMLSQKLLTFTIV